MPARNIGPARIIGALACILVAGLAVVAPRSAQADDWPARPIRLVVAFGPGGTADIFARLLGPELSNVLGQQIVVENRPGGSGVNGSATVAAAPPDGYTLLMCGSGPHITAPAANPHVGYDPLHDFTHIAMVGGDSYVLIAKPTPDAAAGADTLAGWKASGASHVATASPGTGSLGHLLIEQARKMGFDLVHVPYRSAGDGINDLLGGHIGLVMTPVISAIEHVRAHAVVAYGVTTTERNPALADLPTFREQGYDLVGSAWFWVCGPKNLPAPMTARLSTELRRIVKQPALARRFERDATSTHDFDQAELTRFVAEEIARWAPLIEEIGLKLQ